MNSIRLRTMRFPIERLFISLSVRDFRWLWANNVFFSLGIGIEMLAQGWLALELTNSAFWVGAVAGVRGIGMVGFGALGGVIADRVNRRNFLIVLQISRGTAALVLGLLIITGNVQLWHVLAIAAYQGIGQAMTIPVGNALIFDTVGRDLLLNAVAARNTSFNISRIISGVVFGALFATFGLGYCYLAVAAFTTAGSMALVFMRVGKRATETTDSIWKDLADGFSYAFRNQTVRALLLLSVLIEGFGFSHMVLLPVIARDVLLVGPTGLGWLATAGGVGAIIGTLGVAGLGNYRRKGRIIALSALVGAGSLILFANAPWFAVSLALVGVLNAMLFSFDVTLGAVLQLIVPDAMRGRIIGLYSLTWGFTPVGGFLSGSIASAMGAPFALSIGAFTILGYVVMNYRILGRIRDTEAAVGPGDEAAPGPDDTGELSQDPKTMEATP
ncbi:MAG: MFS transporter [Dehalococcoidia bacterium]|nr:MFS transporter [Dehalococcoidia bacterium]